MPSNFAWSIHGVALETYLQTWILLQHQGTNRSNIWSRCRCAEEAEPSTHEGCEEACCSPIWPNKVRLKQHLGQNGITNDDKNDAESLHRQAAYCLRGRCVQGKCKHGRGQSGTITVTGMRDRK